MNIYLEIIQKLNHLADLKKKCPSKLARAPKRNKNPKKSLKKGE